MRVALVALRTALHSILKTLPHAPVEPTLLWLDVNANNERANENEPLFAVSIRTTKRVDARHVTLNDLPRFVRPGCPLRFHLALSSDFCERATYTETELRAALDSLALHARIVIALRCKAQPRTARGLPIQFDVDRCYCKLVATVTADIPELTDDGDCIDISVSVAGQAVAAEQGTPIRLYCIKATNAPLKVSGDFSLLTIAPGGQLFAIPKPQTDSTTIAIFCRDGAILPPPIHLNYPSRCVYALKSAAVPSANTNQNLTMLFVLCSKYERATLTALNARNGAVCWVQSMDITARFIALLSQDLIAVSLPASDRVDVYQTSNGARVAQCTIANVLDITADTDNQVLYADISSSLQTVSAYSWTGTTFVPMTLFTIPPGTDCYYRLFVVVPASRFHDVSYLVVTSYTASQLDVWSLPDHRFVHTYTLDEDNDFLMRALVADPSGTALAIIDQISLSIHVLPWPLPGMQLHIPH